jgi:hypothetical protein
MIKEEILELLKHTEPALLFSFISEYAANDKLFYEKLKAASLPDDNDEAVADMSHYRGMAEDCFDFGSRRGRRNYDYDFYEAAYEASSGLSAILEKASYLEKQGKFAEAAAMAMSVAEVVPRKYENVDDSDGELGDMFSSAIEHLCNIVSNASAPASVKKGIYEWSRKEVNNSIYSDYGCDEIQTIYERCCEALGDTDEVLADIDMKIREAKNEYHKGEAVMKKIRFMQSRNMDTQDVIKKYLDVNEVRKIRFKQLIDAKGYDEALLIAKQGIEIAKKQGHSGTETDWQKSMYDIYLTRGDTASLLPLTEYLFFHAGGRFGKEEFYNVLKNYTPADKWSDTVERLLKTAEQEQYFDHFAARIMHEHQMWTRLFTHCKKGGINEIVKYENDLKPHFEKDILEFYRERVEKQALLTEHGAYLEVARILKQMKTFAGGKELVSQLLEKYRTTYKRRKNMMIALNGV